MKTPGFITEESVLNTLLADVNFINDAKISIDGISIADETCATSQYPAPKMSKEYYSVASN